jgi:uncharacterized membrane protein YphA (DoxX/SURF4 family)
MTSENCPTNIRPGARNIVVIIACVLLAGIFLFAGIGKLAEMGQMPGQTEYLDKMIPDSLYTSGFAYFLGYILIPYILPAIETIVGSLLLAGLFIKIDAIILLMLSCIFIFNNSWMISHGIDKYPDCVCFGIWEAMLGPFSPAMSVRIDILIVVLALIIIFVQPGGIFSSQFWIHNLQKKESLNRLPVG